MYYYETTDVNWDGHINPEEERTQTKPKKVPQRQYKPQYYGSFKTVDGDLIDVEFYISGGTLNSSEQTEVKLGANPVTIKQNGGDNIFEATKPYSCTIQLVTDTYYPLLYNRTAQSVVAKVSNQNNDVLFFGYVTPCVYNQDWATVGDTLEIECISPLSSLQYLNYKPSVSSATTASWYEIICTLCDLTGYYDHFYFPNNYSGRRAGRYTANILQEIYHNEVNFFDDTEDAKPWNGKDVMIEFCKYFGVSAVEYKGELFFVDYNAINYDNIAMTCYYTNSIGKETLYEAYDNYTINAASYKDTGTNISYDEVYNKITVKDNLFEIDEDFDSPVRDKAIKEYSNITDLTPTAQTMDSSTVGAEVRGLWYIRDTKKGNTHVWVKYYKSIDDCNKFYYYSGQHYSDLTPIDAPDEIDYGFTQQYAGSVIVKEATAKGETNSSKSSYPFGNMVTPNNLNTYVLLMVHNIAAVTITDTPVAPIDKPLYTYKTTVKNVSFADNQYLTLNFNAIYTDRSKVMHFIPDYKTDGDTKSYRNYIYLKIKIGDYYIGGYNFAYGVIYDNNGLVITDYQFTETESYVRLDWQNENNYNGKTMKLLSNINWDMGIKSTDGVAFELDDNVKKSLLTNPNVEVTWMMPRSLNEDYRCDAVWLNNINVGIETGDYADLIEYEKDDVKYIGPIDDTYAINFDTLELKVNTQPDNRKSSYSGVIRKDDNNKYGYLHNLWDMSIHFQYLNDADYNTGDNVQEENLVRKYYNHYSTPKLVYQATLPDCIKPWTLIQENNLDTKMVIDTMETDVLYKRTTITAKEF